MTFLERELRSRDALITDLRSSSIGRGAGRQGDNLIAQLKSLQVGRRLRGVKGWGPASEVGRERLWRLSVSPPL